MSIQNLPILTGSINADTNATANTVVWRDTQGGIYGKTVNGTNIQTTGTLTGAPSTQTASFTAGAATDYLCDCTGAAITVTLPLASANSGVIYHFIKKDSSANAVTLSGVLGTGTLSSQYATVRVFSDGTSWYSK